MFANPRDMDESGIESDAKLIRALCEWTGLKPSPLAMKAGLAVTTLTRPKKGKSPWRLSQPTRDKLQRTFPEFPGWLQIHPDLPTLPAQIDYVPVNIMPTYGGMGGGGTGEGDRETALVPRSLIEGELRGKASDFELINVRGDSMEPLFQHGDQLLIDKRDRDPIQPGPFAIFDGDAYYVKLVERVPGRRGWYRVFSANDRYTPDEVEETETTIMGRPVWFGRRV